MLLATPFVSKWCRFRFYQGLGLERRDGSTFVGGTALVLPTPCSHPHFDMNVEVDHAIARLVVGLYFWSVDKPRTA
jgi:hypothetical protein